MSRRSQVAFASLMWNLGIMFGLIGLPTLLGYLAGARLDEGAGPQSVPFRLLFVAAGVALGGVTAWRLLARRRSTD